MHVEDSAVFFQAREKHGHIAELRTSVMGRSNAGQTVFSPHLRSTRPAAAVYVALTAPYRSRDSASAGPAIRKLPTLQQETKLFVGGKEERRRRARGARKRSRRRSNAEHVAGVNKGPLLFNFS